MSLKGTSIYISPNVVSVKGEDARKFLQALLSADINALEGKETAYSLLLNPNGKTLFAMVVYCANDQEFLLISEVNHQNDLANFLKKYLIRTKAQIEDVSKHYQVVISYSVSAQEPLRESDHKIAANLFGDQRLHLVLRKRMLEGEKDDKSIYDALRISCGAISVQKDLGDTSIAQEAGLEKSSISFNKGCFLGQELVCRIDSRSASTPFIYFAVVTPIPVLEGVEVYGDEEAIGFVTSSINADLDKGDFDEFFGLYNAIIKISRKGATLIEEQGSSILRIGGTVAVSKIDKVNGYFRI
jgi:folate-binding protein YgfZ